MVESARSEPPPSPGQGGPHRFFPQLARPCSVSGASTIRGTAILRSTFCPRACSTLGQRNIPAQAGFAAVQPTVVPSKPFKSSSRLRRKRDRQIGCRRGAKGNTTRPSPAQLPLARARTSVFSLVQQAPRTHAAVTENAEQRLPSDVTPPACPASPTPPGTSVRSIAAPAAVSRTSQWASNRHQLRSATKLQTFCSSAHASLTTPSPTRAFRRLCHRSNSHGPAPPAIPPISSLIPPAHRTLRDRPCSSPTTLPISFPTISNSAESVLSIPRNVVPISMPRQRGLYHLPSVYNIFHCTTQRLQACGKPIGCTIFIGHRPSTAPHKTIPRKQNGPSLLH
jgi:hypothetical protein